MARRDKDPTMLSYIDVLIRSSGDKERIVRWNMISSDLLRGGMDPPPDFSLLDIERHGILLKEEGDRLYNDENFDAAVELYTAAIHTGHHVILRSNNKIAWERLSSFYSNRSACFLRLKRIEECLHDADAGIKFNVDSLKSHFSKAKALMMLSDYNTALETALIGLKQAANRHEKAKEFESLICDIQKCLAGSAVPRAVSAGRSWSSVASANLPMQASGVASQSVGPKVVTQTNPEPAGAARSCSTKKDSITRKVLKDAELTKAGSSSALCDSKLNRHEIKTQQPAASDFHQAIDSDVVECRTQVSSASFLKSNGEIQPLDKDLVAQLPTGPLNIHSGILAVENRSVSGSDGFQWSRILSKSVPSSSKFKTVITFPLKDCIYHIVCHACYRDGAPIIPLHSEHNCSQDILVVEEKKTKECFRIRERDIFLEISGKYHLCTQRPKSKSGKQCHHGDACTFPHNDPELGLWTLEKEGKFNIREFIMKVTNKPSLAPLHDLDAVLTQYPGQLAFLCRLCFMTVHCISMRSHLKKELCQSEAHPWQSSVILAHRSLELKITLIGQLPSLEKTASFAWCSLGKYCPKKWTAECMKAHSDLELKLWYVERDCQFTQEQLVMRVRKFNKDHGVDQKVLQRSRSSSVSSSCASTYSLLQSSVDCPYEVVDICDTCWSRSSKTVSLKSSKADKCTIVGHTWNKSLVLYLILPSKKLLRPLPKKYPRDLNFTICRDFAKKQCSRSDCTFAHSDEEIKVWRWMVQNRVDHPKKINMVRQLHTEKPLPKSTFIPAPVPTISAWGAPSHAAKSPLPAARVHLEANAMFYCQYCDIHCNSADQLDVHFLSTKHKVNVNFDKDRQWNYRPPPLGVSASDYSLCSSQQHCCQYNDIGEGESGNYCRFAHSEAELDEWKERFSWRQMKKKNAKKQHLYSYMDQLIDDINATKNLSSVLAHSLDDIQINCSQDLYFFTENKMASYNWTFKVVSDTDLVRVALLYDEHRLHFLFDGVPETYRQHLHGDSLRRLAGSNLYQIKVKFVGGLFGQFSQTVVFDFGQRPVLAKKLKVELGDRLMQQKVDELRTKLNFDRWTEANCEIVPFYTQTLANDRLDSQLNREMLNRYKAQSCAEDVISQSMLGVELNRSNYVARMHQLLKLEEYTQAGIISKFNIETTVKVLDIINEGVDIAAWNGELFARVPLSGQLNDDTDAGHLILWSVSSALLTIQGRDTQQVFEALFVEVEQRKFRGLLRDAVYLRLSSKCCKELALKTNTEVKVEIQFQMNRLLFCQMHYSLDQRHATDLIFPDISAIKTNSKLMVSGLRRANGAGSSQLNYNQMKIIEFVMKDRHRKMIPLVIYGAFGTGKTETLAQAAMMLASQPNNDIKLLICTHTNSAADEYILRYFAQFIINNQHQNVTVLRINALGRKIVTVPKVVQKYCQPMSANGKYFTMPTRKSIEDHKVIVTTLVTSLVLSKLNVNGLFTHIFIDEAAQVHECQTIMPLSLANEMTCVVLAGDHLQMVQKVYSAVARKMKFDRSIVERLYNLYRAVGDKASIDVSSIVQLKHNYRNHPDILCFLSASFYGNKDTLVSCSSQQIAHDVVSLNFFAAIGEERQDERSTSWYNAAEIDEVVERVCQLCTSWPEEWGERDAKSILVTTAYSDQETELRKALRRKGFGDICVLKVHNLPGMEFHAVFVSTVRSRHLISSGVADKNTGEFGFLSDLKMVNTALTRAKSWLAVIGDPVALCSFGACQKLWRTYIKHCEKLGGLTPELSYKDIWIQSQQLTNHFHESGNTAVLENQPISRNAAKSTSSKIAVTSHAVTEIMANTKSCPTVKVPKSKKSKKHTTQTDGSIHHSEMINSNSSVYPTQQQADNMLNNATDSFVSFEEWSYDYQMEPDAIIRELARGIENEKKDDEVTWPEADDNQLIDLRVKHDRAIIHHRRKLLSAENCDDEFDSASEDTDSNGEPTESVEIPETELVQMVRTSPDNYKRCIINLENLNNIFAKPLDQSVPRIMLSSRKCSGKSFHGDEVVVEILSSGHDGAQSGSVLQPIVDLLKASTTLSVTASTIAKPKFPLGKVIGIIKHSSDPKYRMFVCRADDENTGLMVPLNRGIPKICNRNWKRKDLKTPIGHVASYKFTKFRSMCFDRFVKVSNDPPILFIVRFLKWEVGYHWPLGIVVGTLPSGLTAEQTMHIIDIEHSIPRRFRESTLLECLNLPLGSLLQKAINGRSDHRDKLVFTIDPPNSRDLDDALSIEVSGTCRIIGVHIADVSYYVKKSSCVDNEAKRRGSSFYSPVGEPTPMLPPNLSEDVCSLLPDRDCLTLSVFIKVDENAVIRSVQIKRAIIRSQFKLSYAEAEAIIDGSSAGRFHIELISRIQYLYHISCLWRKQRLGCEAVCLPLDISTLDGLKAHALVEEMMIAANHHVAQKLVERFQTMTVLRCQGPPDETELGDWKTRFVEAARNTMVLTRPFCTSGGICQCVDLCSCLPAADPYAVLPHVMVLQSTWSKIKSTIGVNMEKTQSLILTPDYHPQLAIAAQRLRMIQSRSSYVCSSDLPTEQWNHYSLNLPAYTHFTSPIRRYADLVVHRLIGSLLDQTDADYNSSEISDITVHCTDVSVRSRRYESASNVAVFCDLLQKRPLVLYGVVDKPSDSEFCLLFPTLRKFFPTCPKVELGWLNISGKPVVDEEHFELTLGWSQRIYDQCHCPTLLSKRCNLIKLNGDCYAFSVQQQVWSRLVQAAASANHQDITSAANSIRLCLRANPIPEPTSEGIILEREKHFCRYSLKLSAGSIAKVQMSTELFRGVQRPRVQLFYVTPSTCICVEHIGEAVKCFAKPAIRKVLRDKYSKLSDYRKLWLPLIEAEAVYSAVENQHTAIIHNVVIKWQHCQLNDADATIGSFTIPVEFCEKRCITLFADCEPEDKSKLHEQTQSHFSSGRCIAYICVRYQNLKIPVPSLCLPIDKLVDVNENITWVGHCKVSMVTHNKGETDYTISVKLNHTTFAIPKELVGQSNLPATVEWIDKGLPDRRMDLALQKLSVDNLIATNIVLGRDPPPLDAEYVAKARKLANFQVPRLGLANEIQLEAVKLALTERFTLIQGPPGTGKTVTAVRLASLLKKLNNQLPPSFEKLKIRPQVMVCGPSNKSVDVVANYLKDVSGSDTKLVRVYSKTVESEDFPMPGHLVTYKTRAKLADSVSDMRLQSISLHHLIREGDSDAAKFIREMDERLRLLREYFKLTDEQFDLDEERQQLNEEHHVIETELSDLRNAAAVDGPLRKEIKRLRDRIQVLDERRQEIIEQFRKIRKQLVDIDKCLQFRCSSIHHMMTGSPLPSGYCHTAKPPSDEIKKYKEYISAREKEILQSADIILCTCSASGAIRFNKSTNIQQLIIDECAMCKEPESLIPIVLQEPKQIILVGDHQQLQPIILEKSARKCGLGRSLFERYATSRSIMLTIQYRMHQSIMAFPSQQFYANKLEIGNLVQAVPSQLPFWPAGGDGPIAFLHVVGQELTLTVATEEGSEQSKSNLEEVAHVMRIVMSLVTRYKIQQKDIAVLSQYRAQSSLITESLREKKFSNVNVSTVVAAQGSEWDYVILSTVRSLPLEDIDPHPNMKWKGKYLGFITDYHQINVAITRARKGLIIIGNRHLLACDNTWQELLNHYDSQHKLVNGSEFLC